MLTLTIHNILELSFVVGSRTAPPFMEVPAVREDPLFVTTLILISAIISFRWYSPLPASS